MIIITGKCNKCTQGGHAIRYLMSVAKKMCIYRKFQLVYLTISILIPIISYDPDDLFEQIINKI